MAYILGNNCAKNLCKRTVLLQLIIKKCGHMFFWNTVYNSKLLQVASVVQMLWVGSLEKCCLQLLTEAGQ